MQQEGTGNTLLHIVVATDHTLLQALLAKGANCNIQNNKGILTLHVMNFDEGWTPIYTAVVYGYKHLVEIFVSRKSDINLRENVYGQSPLHLACLVRMFGIYITCYRRATNL